GLYLVDVQSKKILRRYMGHSSMVMAVAPSADNRFFVTGSPDQTICLWAVDQPNPLLSLFVAGGEWVAWTPPGDHAASALGERLMGWQVNRGPDAVASYHPAAQFRKSLYRPDVIKLLLQAGSVPQAVALAGKQNNRPPEAVSIGQVLPPSIAITAP